MTTPASTAAIVLAAGLSTRFGDTNKMLADVDGVPMIRRTVDTVVGAGVGQVIVVNGIDGDGVAEALSGLAVEFITNGAPDAGMGHSIAVGAGAVDERAEAVFIVLGDMPFLKSDTLVRMLRTFDGEGGQDIAVPIHDNGRGNPVLFGAGYLDALRTLSGDNGARGIVAAAQDKVIPVHVDDPGVLRDIDTPGDLG